MLKVQDRKFQKQLQTTEDSSCLKTEVSEVNLPETSKRERGGEDAARVRKRTVAHHLWARFYKGSSLKWDAAYQTKAHLYLYARVPGCALLTKQKFKLKIYIYKHSSKYTYIYIKINNMNSARRNAHRESDCTADFLKNSHCNFFSHL